MEGITHVNLIRKGNNVYICHNSTMACIGTLGCQGALVKKLKEEIWKGGVFPRGTKINFMLKSRLKSRKIMRRGYLPLDKRYLKKIFNSYRSRISPYQIKLEGFNLSSHKDHEFP